MPVKSASLSIIKKNLNAVKPNLFNHYIESAAKSYATVLKQISIVSSKTIRKGKETNMSKDLKILSNKLQDLAISLEKVDSIKILPSTGLLIDLQEKVNSKQTELNNLCLKSM